MDAGTIESLLEAEYVRRILCCQQPVRTTERREVEAESVDPTTVRP